MGSTSNVAVEVNARVEVDVYVGECVPLPSPQDSIMDSRAARSLLIFDLSRRVHCDRMRHHAHDTRCNECASARSDHRGRFVRHRTIAARAICDFSRDPDS
jgi:hypothetical protein